MIARIYAYSIAAMLLFSIYLIASDVLGGVRHYRLEEQPKIIGKTVRLEKKVPPEVLQQKIAREAPLLRLGFIDTGYNKSIDAVGVKVCPDGHYDFRTHKAQIGSTLEHGTFVAGAAAQELGNSDYCAVFFQVDNGDAIDMKNVQAAIVLATAEHLAAVNISLEGPAFSMAEKAALRALADQGTMIFIAAGNRHNNLNEACTSYPACYGLPNTYVVGALDSSGFKAGYSNYGEAVTAWYQGDFLSPFGAEQGTSFASPRAMGDWAHALLSRLAAR